MASVHNMDYRHSDSVSDSSEDDDGIQTSLTKKPTVQPRTKQGSSLPPLNSTDAVGGYRESDRTELSDSLPKSPQFSRDTLLTGRSRNPGPNQLAPLVVGNNNGNSQPSRSPRLARSGEPIAMVASPRRQHSTGKLYLDAEIPTEEISIKRDNNVSDSESDEVEFISGDDDDDDEEEEENETKDGESSDDELCVDTKERLNQNLLRDKVDKSSSDKLYESTSDKAHESASDKSEEEEETNDFFSSRMNQTMPEIHASEKDTLAPLSQTLRINSAPLSEPLNRHHDSISQNTYLSMLPAISSRAARMKSYLTGGLRNVGSLLGSEELERCFPDRQVKIYIATWNMHEEKLLPKTIEELILPEDIDYLADIYVIGLQEATPFKEEWEFKIQETLGLSHVQLHSASFGVLHLVIFVRREYIWFCSPVEEDTIATRPGSMIKTKGAIGLSFNFFGTSFLFITSHFTSNDDKLNERLEDYRKICEGLQLPKDIPIMNPYQYKKNDVTTKFDYVFWCGDLNFRLTKERQEVDKILVSMKQRSSPDFHKLLDYDQLLTEMKKDNIFQGFVEKSIKFYPTYKFDLNSDTYDSSAKSRIPSYTDRILCKSRRQNDLKLLTYNSCNGIKISDHRPVYATVQVKIRPGKDGMPLSGGVFNRSVFMEGYKRRSEKSRKNSKNSSVCSVQ